MGEIVYLPYAEEVVKKSIKKVYKFIRESQYVCMRAATEGSLGILVKVMRKYKSHRILVESGEAYCKDDKREEFEGLIYHCYRFPTIAEVKEVLSIVRSNEALRKKIEDAKLVLDPDSPFWVQDTRRQFPWIERKTQYYDPQRDQAATPSSPDENYQRLSIVYFSDK